MKKGYNLRQEKIYEDYHQVSTEKLKEIQANTGNYLPIVIEVVNDILYERSEPGIQNNEEEQLTIIHAPDGNQVKRKDNPENFFTLRGRIGRDQFFIRSLLLNLIYIPLNFEPTELFEGYLIIIYAFLLIAAYILNFIQRFKRYHDFNRNGWHSLWSIIPIVSIILWVVLISTKGTKGENKYGTPPKITKHFKS